MSKKISNSFVDPGMAALFSFLFGGAGHLFFLGQKLKGIVLILTGIPLIPVTGGLTLLLSAIDAYVIGKRLENGASVDPWEFFWNRNDEHIKTLKKEQDDRSEQRRKKIKLQYSSTSTQKS